MAKLLYPKDIIEVHRFESTSPKKLIFQLTDYLHEIFGTIGRLIADAHPYEIPRYHAHVIAAILRHNNIVFDSVTMLQTQTDLIELMWFSLDLTEQCNSLTVYYNQKLLDSFYMHTTNQSNVPVLLEPYSHFNWLTSQNATFDQTQADHYFVVDTRVVPMFVTCDHLAQHIIHEYCQRLNPLTDRGFIVQKTADIHQTWLDCPGFTWHSVVSVIAKNTTYPQKSNTTSNARFCTTKKLFTPNDGIYYD